jgi:hypothetical protein
MDCEDDSECIDPNTGMPSKKLIGRSYMLSDGGVYERVIRKRKRKSSE